MRTLNRLVISLSVCALLSACASHGVHCDGRSTPINLPPAAGGTPPRAP